MKILLYNYKEAIGTFIILIFLVQIVAIVWAMAGVVAGETMVVEVGEEEIITKGGMPCLYVRHC